MGGGGGGGGGTTFTIPHNKRWHTVAGKGLCAVMWACVILGMVMMTILMVMDISMRDHRRLIKPTAS
uniref:Uncharacterized protein n=1 Tax=Oryza meridionalis TaxID=40149 RepID=A0A0E0E6J4_9ORYZ